MPHLRDIKGNRKKKKKEFFYYFRNKRKLNDTFFSLCRERKGQPIMAIDSKNAYAIGNFKQSLK